jgi:hypothetical protein
LKTITFDDDSAPRFKTFSVARDWHPVSIMRKTRASLNYPLPAHVNVLSWKAISLLPDDRRSRDALDQPRKAFDIGPAGSGDFDPWAGDKPFHSRRRNIQETAVLLFSVWMRRDISSFPSKKLKSFGP